MSILNPTGQPLFGGPYEPPEEEETKQIREYDSENPMRDFTQTREDEIVKEQ